MYNVDIDFKSTMGGFVTYRDLINPAGTLHFDTNYSETKTDGYLFRVVADDYFFGQDPPFFVTA